MENIGICLWYKRFKILTNKNDVYVKFWDKCGNRNVITYIEGESWIGKYWIPGFSEIKIDKFVISY